MHRTVYVYTYNTHPDTATQSRFYEHRKIIVHVRITQISNSRAALYEYMIY